MYICVICRFQVVLDDAIAGTSSGRCVCLRCFSRETETYRSMSKELQRDLSAALAAPGVAWAA